MGQFAALWPPEQDAELRRLWADGMPTKAMAAVFKVTKNSVIGRVHRLRLPPRPSCIHAAGEKPATVAERKPARGGTNRRPMGTTGESAKAPQPRAKVAEAPGGCRSPLWTDRERPTHRYCDASRSGLGPYCATHRLVAYTSSRAALARVAGGEIASAAIPAALPAPAALHAQQHEDSA